MFSYFIIDGAKTILQRKFNRCMETFNRCSKICSLDPHLLIRHGWLIEYPTYSNRIYQNRIYFHWFSVIYLKLNLLFVSPCQLTKLKIFKNVQLLFFFSVCYFFNPIVNRLVICLNLKSSHPFPFSLHLKFTT